MSTRRVIVLGGDGMLGHTLLAELKKTAADKHDIVYSARQHPDERYRFAVEDGAQALDGLFAATRPTLVINCIAVLASDVRESDPSSMERAIRVNSLFPLMVSKSAEQIGARVLHVSTDAVFSRSADRCDELRQRDPDDIYGKTKALGEVLAPHVLSIRSSFIGRDPKHRRGLVEMVWGEPNNGTVKGFTNHLWTGVTTKQFAHLCEKLCDPSVFDACRSESPVHHFCPNRALSKFELLKLIAANLRLDIHVEPVEALGGALQRILTTRYGSLRKLVPWDLDIAKAIEEL